MIIFKFIEIQPSSLLGTVNLPSTTTLNGTSLQTKLESSVPFIKD